MSTDHKTAPGGHYSGKNPVPNIQRFIESLDSEKKQRDARIEAEMNANLSGGDIHDHVEGEPKGVKDTRKFVTDPTTGNQVQIEDVNTEFMKAAKEPMVCEIRSIFYHVAYTEDLQAVRAKCECGQTYCEHLGESNVAKSLLSDLQTVKTDKTQSGKEYAHNQDITAPPDPVAPGSTSDVPIHGEKTNILFHPTPSVSYEPMYQAMETQASILAISVLIAIVVLGKMFGGALYGLIPLGMCVGSGIFLWMKEAVRSGREVEWSSEQQRGETVRILPLTLVLDAN
jgi:hypothetical protein